jgi:hypothetical protein
MSPTEPTRELRERRLRASCTARRAAWALVLLLSACAPVGSVGPSLSPTLASSPPSASSPTGTPLAGACTSASRSSKQVLEQLFALSTSGDWRKVADCYARSYQEGGAGFPERATRWAAAGPAALEHVLFVDRVNECDRFEVVAELANGAPVGWQGRQRVFYSVGLESGVPRVFDAGSALASREVTRVACR